MLRFDLLVNQRQQQGIFISTKPIMGHLNERTVQVHAVSHLKKKYTSKSRWGRVFSSIEVRTKKKYGSKRADGLLAFKHWLFGTYVVSLEAKSFKTIQAIKPNRDNWTLIKNSLWMATMILVGTGAILAIYRMNDGYFQFVIPFNVFVISGLTYAYFTRSSYQHQRLKVLDQLAQYPANEQWLAFSNDAVQKMGKEKYNILIRICKSQGVGVVVVSKNAKVQVKLKPKMHYRFWKDYLKYYSIGQEVLKEI